MPPVYPLLPSVPGPWLGHRAAFTGVSLGPLWAVTASQTPPSVTLTVSRAPGQAFRRRPSISACLILSHGYRGHGFSGGGARRGSVLRITAYPGTCCPRGPSLVMPPGRSSLPSSTLSLRMEVTGITRGTATSEWGAGSPPWGWSSYIHYWESFQTFVSSPHLFTQSIIYLHHDELVNMYFIL